MNCIIVDDDDLSRKLVEGCVERTEFLELAGSFASAKDAINFLRNNRTDLIFLDIEMPEISGFEMLEQLTSVPQIILVTSKRDYAVEAFEYDVTDFILKPIDYDRFAKAVLKAKGYHEAESQLRSTDNDFFIKRDSKLMKVDLSTILYVEALADYVNFHMDDPNPAEQRFTVLTTMKSVESKLPFRDFCRVHRSYIIRIDKIKSISDKFVLVADRFVPVSRANKEVLLKKLKVF
ncbi:MAG: LytR/AlgR family response regulator transcription factor [Bacteroidia bacterium]